MIESISSLRDFLHRHARTRALNAALGTPLAPLEPYGTVTSLRQLVIPRPEIGRMAKPAVVGDLACSEPARRAAASPSAAVPFADRSFGIGLNGLVGVSIRFSIFMMRSSSAPLKPVPTSPA